MQYDLNITVDRAFNLPTGMLEAVGQGGRTLPQILANQKASPDSGGAPHYYLPPQIFRPCNMPDLYIYLLTLNSGP